MSSDSDEKSQNVGQLDNKRVAFLQLHHEHNIPLIDIKWLVNKTESNNLYDEMIIIVYKLRLLRKTTILLCKWAWMLLNTILI